MGIYRVGEIIKMSRKSLGLTQEELSEGICAVVTLSRIENGRQEPGKSVYERLMERMGQETSRAYAMISGNDLLVMEYQNELENAIHSFEYQNAEKIFDKLKKIVDESPASWQYMKRIHAILESEGKRITPAQARKELDEALEITVRGWKDRKFDCIPFMEQEMLIMCNIANTYSSEKNWEKAIEILEGLCKILECGYMKGEKKDDTQILIFNNLANNYGVIGENSKAIQITNQAIALCKQKKRCGSLARLIGEQVWNMEQLLNQGEKVDFTRGECEKGLRQSYYLATALGQGYNAKSVKKYYEKYYK